MPLRVADAVSWADLRDAVLWSLVAGVGISAAYGFVLLGAVRARERYDRGDLAQTAVYGLIGLAGPVITLGGLTLGIIFLTKD